LIAVGSHRNGSVIPVLAQPGAKRNAILGERAGALRVAVTSPPEKGKANQAIQTVLADVFDCRPSQVELISGKTSRQKRFLITGLEPAELQARLAAILSGSGSSSGSGRSTGETDVQSRPR
jgi:uncharacterized protein